MKIFNFVISALLLMSAHVCGQEDDSYLKEAAKSDAYSDTSADENTAKPAGKEKDKPDDKEEAPENAKEADKEKNDLQSKEIKPPAIGNFALPTSQQPWGLFAFGGNIIDKGECQVYLFGDDFVGRRKLVTDVIPSFLFGIEDNLSIFFVFPYLPDLRDGCDKSHGLGDCFVQLEYAFYNKSTYCYTDQATILGNVTVPSGSVRKNPPTGFGSPSYFIGATYTRMYVDWFYFVAPGAVLTTSSHCTRIGDQFLYQCGFGRNIPSPAGWIYAWMIEVDGQYSRKNRIRGVIDDNSGGNAIYVTPSVWVSSEHFLIQFGVSLPVNQNLFGYQRKFDYALNINMAWSFY